MTGTCDKIIKQTTSSSLIYSRLHVLDPIVSVIRLYESRCRKNYTL